MTRKLLLVAAVLTVSMGLSVSAFAVACGTGATPVFTAVGSSAQFNSFAYAVAIDKLGAGNYNLLTYKNGLDIAVQDNRPSPPRQDNATLWVIWDNNTNCNVYSYFSIDSTAGVRAFFAIGTDGTYAAYPVLVGTLDGGSGNGSASHNQVNGLPDTTTTMPHNVYVALNGGAKGARFNAAMTDIRPEDALFAMNRALAALNTTTYAGLGYANSSCGGNGTTVGCPFYSGVGTGSVAWVTKFATTGNDPIGLKPVPKYLTLSTGASPIMVLVGHNSQTAVNHFGHTVGSSYQFTNIQRSSLQQVFQGLSTRTGDLITNSATANATVGFPIQVVQRESLSGTYNTFEFTGIRTYNGNGTKRTQEFGVDPTNHNVLNDAADCGTGAKGSFPTGTNNATSCDDPLLNISAHNSGSFRVRAIGTGELVKSLINGNTGMTGSAVEVKDSIGYAFWSYGNVSPLTKVTTSGNQHLGHYLTVDGVDPIFNTPADNPEGLYNLPTCQDASGNFVFPCTDIPLTHIQDGSYPMWSLLRVVTFSPAPAIVNELVNDAQLEAADPTRNLSDFIPFDNSGNLGLFVFRAHYGGGAFNGHKGCTNFAPPTGTNCLIDKGQDMGGAIYPVQQDVTNVLDFGKELVTNYRQ